MDTDPQRIKLTVQKRIVIFSVLLFAGKVVAYFLTNSIGILTDALESTVNVLTGFISVYSIGLALKPRDADHPFGHGKIESLSASIEGILIIIAGLVIVFEAVKRVFDPAEIQQLDIGIVIVAVAGLVNYILGYYSIRVGKKHNSIALVAGGKHLQSDTYSSIGLVIGLILLWVTKFAWLDSLIAVVFGVVIIYTGYKILQETASNLMDKADFLLMEKINNALWENRSECWVDVHHIKMVKYGNAYHVDCDLTIPWYYNVNQAHAETRKLKEVVWAKIPAEIDFTIHTDACNDTMCHKCTVNPCPYRGPAFAGEEKWTLVRKLP
ncbi:MAG: cation diffusion facilitator family transporter [Breznakibacter sp.]